jgi:hypothetical protein
LHVASPQRRGGDEHHMGAGCRVSMAGHR